MGIISGYWHGHKPRAVLTVIHEPDYRQHLGEGGLDAAAESLAAWAESAANVPPAFFPDFGTISMAKPWGGRVRSGQDGAAYIEPVAGTVDEALRIEPGENADAHRAVEMYHELRRRTGIENLRFKTPDFQGPLNTAAMIVRQDELLVAMHEQPEKVDRLLEIVTERNIATMQWLRRRAGRTDGNIWPYVWLPDDCGVMVTEDMMPLLSAETYARFGLPALERISEALGGLLIHCCGVWGRHAASLARCGARILGLEFHYPFTRIEEIRPHLPDAVLVPYLAGFKTDDYESFPAYAAALLDRQDAGPIWIAVSDAPDWRAHELRDVVAARGGQVDGFGP